MQLLSEQLSEIRIECNRAQRQPALVENEREVVKRLRLEENKQTFTKYSESTIDLTKQRKMSEDLEMKFLISEEWLATKHPEPLLCSRVPTSHRKMLVDNRLVGFMKSSAPNPDDYQEMFQKIVKQ